MLALAFSLLLSMSVLIGAGEDRLGVYLSVFAIFYFANVEIFRPRKSWIDLIGIFLFISFVILVAFKAAEVLGYNWVIF